MASSAFARGAANSDHFYKTAKRPICSFTCGLWFHRTVAGTAVEIATVFELNSFKTLGNTFDANVLVAIVVGLTVRLRKISGAHLAALWAHESFSPLIAAGYVHQSILRDGFKPVCSDPD
jgi:hypothetical protein